MNEELRNPTLKEKLVCTAQLAVFAIGSFAAVFTTGVVLAITNGPVWVMWPIGLLAIAYQVLGSLLAIATIHVMPPSSPLTNH